MRYLFYLILILSLSSCTSTRKLSKKFSTKTASVSGNFKSELYSNKAVNRAKPYQKNSISLWRLLSTFRVDKDSIMEGGEDMQVRLTLLNTGELKVDAVDSGQQIATFRIPVTPKNNYLILEKKRNLIPLPFIYFKVKEEISILSALQNGRIGYSSHHEDSLWILFFGASNTSGIQKEYERIK